MKSSVNNSLGISSTYETLKDQFKVVNRILKDTNNKLTSKEGELDVLTYYLNSIVSHMSQGLVFVNLEGHVTTCNPAAETMLGINSMDILFHPFTDFFSDHLFGFSMKQALAERKAPKKNFVAIETKQGTKEFEIDTTFVLMHDADTALFHHLTAYDSLQGMIVLIRDFTEIHRLQNIANRNDRMKALGEMAAMVAHEVRNPLGGIKGFASLLQRDLEDQPKLKQLATYIIEGTDSLNKLVTNVLKYSRPVQTTIKSTDIVKLVREISQHIQADACLSPNLKIEVQTALESLNVPLDISMFKSALMNLIVNAIQAIPNSGSITLKIETEMDQALVRVIDTGVGIADENMKKLFSPFFTTKATGNGFGLAEVDQVVRAHGGSIEVTSVINKGSTFTIKIPLKPFGDYVN